MSREYIVIKSIVLWLVFLSVGLGAHVDAAQQRVKDAVVKIHTTSAAPDFFTPWRLLNANQSSGSGAVISGNRILTNAHVIADARYIQAQKNDDPKKYLAKVEFVSHAADLAILKIEDANFFRGIKPLSFGNLPDPLQEVSVYGYPMGGSSLSITQGIMSRVEHQFYAHAGSHLLAGQIDAAINPGNSGGPVIVGNKIVGVVMQANSGGRAENLGYFVPPSVIEHVLKDAKDGVHHGFVELGFRTQNLESPAMKASLGVSDKNSGVLVAKIFTGSSADGVIFSGDVITHIDNFEIADDESIEFLERQRTHYKYALDQHHIGNTVAVTLIRNGEKKTVELTAFEQARNFNLVRPQTFDTTPEYYIYGGVVFVPLNMNLIQRWGRDWRRKAPNEFLNARRLWSSREQQELVVALKVLPADVNLGYHDWSNWIIESVNGQKIKNFSQFSQLLHSHSGSHITFSDDTGYKMVIDSADASASEADIMQLYRVPSSHSAGLFEQE